MTTLVEAIAGGDDITAEPMHINVAFNMMLHFDSECNP
jgi:hypothetical protein